MAATGPTNGGASNQLPHLFSPLQVGPHLLRNRVLITAHVPHLADNGAPGARYAAYHRARARGGAGLQITGATPVHRTSKLAASDALHNTDDSVIPGYQILADAVHGEGGRILAQLAHYGATIHAASAGQPLWSPSDVGSELVRETPHAMTTAEIDEVVRAFGAAASRARQGGLDGVEILGAFGLLIASFMSPYANKRTDAYGGSLENRLRFAIEIIEAVREGAGSGLIVGMRIPGDEFVDDGLDAAAMQEIAQVLEATGKLDYLNVIAGINLDRVHRATHWPPTPAPHGLFVPLAAGIKRAVSLPVFTVRAYRRPAARRAYPRRRSRRHGRHDARPYRRPGPGDQGARGPARRHPALRRRQCLHCARHGRRADPLHPQPRGRARA